jgi:SacI homology domain
MLLIPSTLGQKWMSYVQIRGSVPVHWAEVMDLKYKPKLRILETIDKSVFIFQFARIDILGPSCEETFR